MKKHLLDAVRNYVLSGSDDDHPLSPLIVAADILEMPKQQVSLAFWYLQREGLVGKYKPDGNKYEIWARTSKALEMYENRVKKAEKKAEN